MAEEWKIIDEFPNYKISNYGKIKNITTGKIIYKNNNSALLINDNKKMSILKKFLVARYFINNKITFEQYDFISNDIRYIKFFNISFDKLNYYKNIDLSLINIKYLKE